MSDNVAVTVWQKVMSLSMTLSITLGSSSNAALLYVAFVQFGGVLSLSSLVIVSTICKCKSAVVEISCVLFFCHKVVGISRLSCLCCFS